MMTIKKEELFLEVIALLLTFSDTLLNLLQYDGGEEAISKDDLEKYLQLLVGSKEFGKLPHEIQADDFAENVLGFEEVEEVEDEENGYDG